MKYRKKPVVIEAVQWRYSGIKDWPAWLSDAFARSSDSPGSFFRGDDERFRIHTLEGFHIVNDGDYIIRGIKGELYPCKPDIFAATYEAVDD